MDLSPIFFKRVLKLIQIFYKYMGNSTADPSSFFVFPDSSSYIYMSYDTS